MRQLLYFHAGIVLNQVEIIGISISGTAAAIAGVIAIIILVVIITMCRSTKKGKEALAKVSFCRLY